MALYENLKKRFTEVFQCNPAYYVRCPGRVNLIGEHIDYSDYSVFPMAISNSTELLISPNNSEKIRIHNLDSLYPSYEVDLPTSWTNVTNPKWYDYALCGWKSITTIFNFEPKGYNIMIGGNIPPSSGLSSSSSVVCSVALATLLLHTNEGLEKIGREQFAKICAEAEHLIGTQGGGMDQAAEILSINGKALKIDFNPLKAEPVSLPPRAKFVVLHSGATLNKAATSQYNQRVTECRVAAKLLLKLQNKSQPTNRIAKLREVQGILGYDLTSMISLVEKELPEEASREELNNLLGADEVSSCIAPNTEHLTIFKIRSRARHVYSEALRVSMFADACKNNDILEMGKLMTQSHESCKKDYECSCEALDKLVQSCLESGALGARLTGAGWGGCVVSLVDSASDTNLSHLNVLFNSFPCAGIEYKYL